MVAIVARKAAMLGPRIGRSPEPPAQGADIGLQEVLRTLSRAWPIQVKREILYWLTDQEAHGNSDYADLHGMLADGIARVTMSPQDLAAAAGRLAQEGLIAISSGHEPPILVRLTSAGRRCVRDRDGDTSGLRLDAETTAPSGPGQAAGHAFISYVREDAAHADHLQRALEDAGIPVWRDTSSLWPGQDWQSPTTRWSSSPASPAAASAARSATRTRNSSSLSTSCSSGVRMPRGSSPSGSMTATCLTSISAQAAPSGPSSAQTYSAATSAKALHGS